MRKITFKESSLSQKPKTYNLKNTYVILRNIKSIRIIDIKHNFIKKLLF